jgi:endonuclease V-like protein UPF0215 family
MNRNAFRNMPIVGVEDGSFQKGVTRRTLLVAVLFKGSKIEDVKAAKITVDGLDATARLLEMLDEWEFAAILLAGVSFAGFNIIDPATIRERSKKPVIVVTRTKPDNKAVRRALQRHFRDWRMRWGVFRKSSFREMVSLGDAPPIYVETIGGDDKWTFNLIHALSVCRIPEPIRIARLIARGLS